MSLTPGNKLGGYEILAAIGAGGMGEVYRARDIKLGREVATKKIGSAAVDRCMVLAQRSQIGDHDSQSELKLQSREKTNDESNHTM